MICHATRIRYIAIFYISATCSSLIAIHPQLKPAAIAVPMRKSIQIPNSLPDKYRDLLQDQNKNSTSPAKKLYPFFLAYTAKTSQEEEDQKRAITPPGLRGIFVSTIPYEAQDYKKNQKTMDKALYKGIKTSWSIFALSLALKVIYTKHPAIQNTSLAELGSVVGWLSIIASLLVTTHYSKTLYTKRVLLRQYTQELDLWNELVHESGRTMEAMTLQEACDYLDNMHETCLYTRLFANTMPMVNNNNLALITKDDLNQDRDRFEQLIQALETHLPSNEKVCQYTTTSAVHQVCNPILNKTITNHRNLSNLFCTTELYYGKGLNNISDMRQPSGFLQKLIQYHPQVQGWQLLYNAATSQGTDNTFELILSP